VIKAVFPLAPTNISLSLKGQCKRADFIIIADNSHRENYLLYEMKTKDQKTKITQ